MIPILFDAKETNFDTMGIGPLADATHCVVSETRNGAYELTLKYPVSGPLFSELDEDRIIKAKANKKDADQLFRLYKSSKPISGIVTWYGEHISYDMNYCPVYVSNMKSQSCAGATNSIIQLSPVECPFTAYSDILTVADVNINQVVSVRKALGGMEGSILDTFGGEYHFDNFRIELLKERGVNTEVELRYGKNITDANMEKNISNVVTAIYPYATYFDSENEQEVIVRLPEEIITSDGAGAYARSRAVPVDLSSKWDYGSSVTEDMLREAAEEYIKTVEQEPKISLKVSYADLMKCKDETNIKVIEDINLCDTVPVYIEKLGISVKAKVVKYNFNALTEVCESVEIGSVQPNLAKDLSQMSKNTETIKENNHKAQNTFLKTIMEATKAITGNSGGYVVLRPAENPEEILIMDTPDVKTAKNVWRWNLAGLGHSSNGVNGPFELAITAAGQIAGQFIAADSITANALNIEYRNSVVGKGNVSAQLSVEDGNINIAGNRFQLNSDNFIVSPEGVTTQKAANITGGKIDISTDTKEIPVVSMHFINASGMNIDTQIMASGILTKVDNIIRSWYFPAIASLNFCDETGTTTTVVSKDLISTTGTKNRIVETENYDSRLMYCYEMPNAMFGDIGSGVIGEDGICIIEIESIFAECVNTDIEYFVFCQGNVEVVEKGVTYFVVKGEPGTIFDWELKAKQKGYDVERLDVMSLDDFQDFNYIASANEYLEEFEEELLL